MMTAAKRGNVACYAPIAMSAEAMAARIRRVLARHTDIKLALLFGSHARGTAGPASDVDVAVTAGASDCLALAAELAEALEREVDVLPLDDEVGYPLLMELLRDGIVVHDVAGAAARWRARALTTAETDRPWFERMRDAWLKHVSEHGV
jgi:predicted nucleotidyltransferase